MDNKVKIQLSKPAVDDADIRAVTDTLRSGILVQGPKAVAFEKAFASYAGVSHAVAVSSGTAALHCAVHALGIGGPGDEVITTPFTFIATASSVLYERAKVVFADIRSEDFLIDPDEIKKKVTKRTKAVITVDLFGKLCDYEAIRAVVPKHVAVIEDSAQAVGAVRSGIHSGAWGDIGIFSLYATKNIMVGEGGMLTTNSEKFARASRLFRNVGQSDRYVYEGLGYHYRMPEMSAALGLSQLSKVERFNKIRRKNAEKLRQGLGRIQGVILPWESGSDHVYHQFTMRITPECKHTRDEIVKYMECHGIQVGTYYPKPLHLYPMFMEMGYRQGDFPVAEEASKEVLALPVHPLLSDADLDLIIRVLKSYIT
jgi:perosamine synthetase